VVPGRGDEVTGMRNRCGRWGLVEVGAEGVVWGLLRLRLRLGGAGGLRAEGGWGCACLWVVSVVWGWLGCGGWWVRGKKGGGGCCWEC